VAIALGSNLGDRDAHLAYATASLSPLLISPRFSSRIDTAPVGSSDGQPNFLNAAVVGDTTLAPLELLRALLAIERARGRERPYPNAPRTLDLDLILYGTRIVESGELILPHPRFRERRFVLAPLAEIAPDMVDPVTGMTMAALLAALERE
jgi:2-amino-4-hydroxy-6-hydroxymethyldihydropteridine diphosphokinase